MHTIALALMHMHTARAGCAPLLNLFLLDHPFSLLLGRVVGGLDLLDQERNNGGVGERGHVSELI